ncbi:hypothetical protein [Actinoplanes sp. M2I2]|uniref:hypothetical protein n=1 Tax=Actinoplanes sp. M2I2 TaxID=1734444 RepID=UPI002020C055|nr:hypothetical protein [Actinoplanes sp. M2I2]
MRRLKQSRLRPEQVPQAEVSLDPACVELFGRFNAMRRRLAPDRQLPIESEVMFVLGGSGVVSVWTPPTERFRATLVGRLTGAAVTVYEEILTGLDRDSYLMGWLTANEVAPGVYHAFAGGHPL